MTWGLGSWGGGSWGIGGGTDNNLGFETPGASPGLPDKWSRVPFSTALVYVEFTDSDPDTTLTVDTFSWGAVAILSPIWALPTWGGGASVETFDSWTVGIVLEPALSGVVFNAINPDPKIVEDFETYWAGNQNYLTEFVGVGTDLTAVTFDGPSDVEDWEDGWGNDAYLTQFLGVGFDLTAVLFDGTAAWSSSTEDWNQIKLDIIFYSDPVSETLRTVVHGLSVNDVVYFYNENGALPTGLLEFPTPWYVYFVPSGDSLRVSPLTNPPAVAPQDIQDFGSGTHYLKFDISQFWTEIL